MNIRLIGTDLDGTLLDANGRITDETRRALKMCEERGIKLAIASGRCFEMTYGFRKEAAADMILICCNGSRIETDPDGEGAPLVDLRMPDAASKQVYDTLMASGLYFVAYRKGIMYVGNPDAKWHKDRPAGFHNWNGRVLETVTDPVRVSEEVWHETYKYVIYSQDRGDIASVREKLDKLPVRCESSWWDNCEIMRSDIDKGSALLKVAEAYGIKRDEIMAFGDNFNDCAMLKAAGWPVVMENGEAEVKKLAKIIAPANTENGVAQIIDRYILEADT